MALDQSIKLAVLDDYAGLSKAHFDPLKVAGHVVEVSYYPETLNTQTEAGLKAAIERLRPYQVISSMRERTQFPKALLAQLPNLRLLMNSSSRNQSLDSAAAEEHNILVTGTTYHNVHSEAVAKGFNNTTQHAWSLILALASHIPEDDRVLRQDKHAWQTGFMTSLAGKTIGLCGLGRLGATTARTAVLGFGMKVIAWSPNLTQEKADETAKTFDLEAGIFKVVSKEELFRQSDVLSIHLVLSERSRDTIGLPELQAMKKTAFLVNTSRAPLINEDALWDTLSQGKISGAALDVWWEEPMHPDSRWRGDGFFGVDGRSRLIMSPHMGYVEGDVMRSWYQEQADILMKWLNGDNLEGKIMKST